MAAPRYSVSLEELQALNDEIRSLARAGIPVERGLREISQDLPGELGRLAAAISSRLERGENLVQVLQDDQLALPPVYNAVVAAGVRSGRLPAALESLTHSIQRATELRRTLIVSMIYPLIVLTITTGLFYFTWTHLFPAMQDILPSLLEREMPVWFQWLTWTVNRGTGVLVVLWGVLTLGAVVWLVRSQQALRFGGGSGHWPSVATVNAAGRSATFAEMLALLLEHQVPLGEALNLAGGASGDRRIRAAAEELADRVRAGGAAAEMPAGLPPLLSWLILTGSPTQQLVRILRQTADGLRDRAQRMCLYLGVYLPITFSATLGAIIALYYAVLILTPFYFLLFQLAQP